MNKKKDNNLLKSNTAVESYLDNLLQEATESEGSQDFPLYADPNHNIHVLETPLTIAKREVAIEESIAEDVLVEEVSDKEDIDDVVEEPINAPTEQTVQQELTADSFEFPVQCMMFKVNGHLLSIPLIQLGSVIPFGQRLTTLPRSPDYFKGLLKYREHNVRVVDTESLLLNKKSEREFSPSHLLVFASEDWAISCDELLEVVTLNEDDIKWHGKDSERLSIGTIRESLALILNPQAICKKLLSRS